MKFSISLFILLFGISLGYSQDFVYKAKNPNFGGDTFNYQWLLSSAEAQNKFTEPRETREQLSDVERFTQSLNNQLLSQLSRSLFQSEFGDGGIQEGTFTFGSLFVEVTPSSEGLVVNILDTNTGDQTQIVIPN